MSPRAEKRFWAVGIASGRYFYLCGGTHGDCAVATVERFDPQLERWEAMPPLNVRRAWPAGASVGERLYVCGGRDGKHSLDVVECFDPKLGTWEVQQPLAQARHGAAAAALNGRVYVCGGLDGGLADYREALSTVERFDARRPAGAWTAMPHMIHARGWPACVAIQDHLYVFGGRGIGGAVNYVERFQWELKWEILSPMLTARYGAVGVVASGRILVLGGRAGPDVLNTVEAYDLDGDCWESEAGMSHGRAWFAGAVLPKVDGPTWRKSDGAPGLFA